MKLCRFRRDGAVHIGKVIGNQVVDLTEAADVGISMRALIGNLEAVRSKLEAASTPSYSLADVELEAPIADAQKYLAIGMNYEAHAAEAAAAGVPVPTSQLWFNKQVSCVTGPYAPVDLPRASTMLDYEAELGFVIGTRCRHVSVENALSVVAGYFVCNDVTARDWQQRSPTFTLGKSFDTHGPIGPWITTADEVPDPHALTLHLSVNGVEKQRTSTADMIYDICEQIAYLSTVMTLEPGDLIATGTPSNVGITTQSFLQPGDVVRVEVDGLGFIENRIVNEGTAAYL